MTHRTLAQTVSESFRRMLTTPPSTWYSQWKQRNRRLPDTRIGYLDLPATYSGDQLLVGGFEVMQAWERPLMRALAEEAARSRGHVLEVGFGMGISATYLIEAGCSRYTVIEPHRAVLERFRSWERLQSVPVQAVEGFWEDRIDELGLFDGILFDTYPVSEPEADEKVYVPFIPKASAHLRPGGVFTFYTGYADALPPKHMELLKKHFTSVRLYHLEGLKPPKDCQYFHHSRMVVPICTK